MRRSLTKRLMLEFIAVRKTHYLLEIYLHDEKAERTITSYLNHIAMPVTLTHRSTDSNGSSLIYDIVLSQQDTDFMQNLLTINGVSKASLTIKK